MFGFGASLLALACAALSIGSVPLAAAGPTAGIERPYTNAEAIRRGLPLLKPRQPSRSWSARKRAASPSLGRIGLLTFDDLASTTDAGVLNTMPAVYQGFNWLGGPFYANEASFAGSWSPAQSPANWLFLNAGDSTFEVTRDSPFRLRSLYCGKQVANLVTNQFILVGLMDFDEVFAVELACTPLAGPMTLNTFDNLPLINRFTFRLTMEGGANLVGNLDNIEYQYFD